MDDITLKNVADKLKAVIVADKEVLDTIYIELQTIKGESKSWGIDTENTATTLSQNGEKIVSIEIRLTHSCAETNDIKNMKWLYQQFYKDVGFYCIKNTTKSAHDLCITTVIDLVSRYEQNCRMKEELENMLNQVHRKLDKFKAKQMLCSGNSQPTCMSNSTVPCEIDYEDNLPMAIQNVCIESSKEDRLSDNMNVDTDQNVQLATHAAGSETDELCDYRTENQNVDINAERSALQVKVTPSRTPLAPLDLNLCRGDNSPESAKTDPLTRVRSPVLCAYLRKSKD